MWQLVKAELLRFRRAAIGFAIIHLLLLIGIAALSDLFAADAAKLSLAGLGYSLAGLILGLYQLGSYRRLNQWAYLVHRPLAPTRIFASLSGAAGLLIGAVIAAPLLLTTALTDMLTHQPIDLRHYLMALFVLGLGGCFYLLGCFIALAPTRASLLALGLPAFFLSREVVGLWVFVPQALVLAWSFLMAAAVFRVDLQSPLRRPLALALVGLPMLYGLLWVLNVAVAVGYSTQVAFAEHGWKSFAAHRWDDYFRAGTYPHTEYLASNEALLHGLQLAEGDPDLLLHLRRQVPLADVLELRGTGFPRFPHRQQLMLQDRRNRIEDAENEIGWVFDHDQMLFLGRDLRSGQPAGWLGPDGRAAPGAERPRPFSSIPYVVDNRFLVTADRLWQLELRNGVVRSRFQAQGGERLTTALIRQGQLGLIKTDQRLLFFDLRGLAREPAELTPTASVPLPDAPRNLGRIHIAELVDGHLISFLIGAQSERGFHPARQILVELNLDGTSRSVAELELEPGLPAWYRHRGILISPALQTAHDLVWTAIGPNREQRVELAELLGWRPPLAVGLAAVALAMLSSALLWALGSRYALPIRQRLAWSLLGLLVSVPAVPLYLFLAAPTEAAVKARRRSGRDTTALPGLASAEGRTT